MNKIIDITSLTKKETKNQKVEMKNSSVSYDNDENHFDFNEMLDRYFSENLRFFEKHSVSLKYNLCLKLTSCSQKYNNEINDLIVDDKDENKNIYQFMDNLNINIIEKIIDEFFLKLIEIVKSKAFDLNNLITKDNILHIINKLNDEIDQITNQANDQYLMKFNSINLETLMNNLQNIFIKTFQFYDVNKASKIFANYLHEFYLLLITSLKNLEASYYINTRQSLNYLMDQKTNKKF